MHFPERESFASLFRHAGLSGIFLTAMDSRPPESIRDAGMTDYNLLDVIVRTKWKRFLISQGRVDKEGAVRNISLDPDNSSLYLNLSLRKQSYRLGIEPVL